MTTPRRSRLTPCLGALAAALALAPASAHAGLLDPRIDLLEVTPFAGAEMVLLAHGSIDTTANGEVAPQVTQTTTTSVTVGASAGVRLGPGGGGAPRLQ